MDQLKGIENKNNWNKAKLGEKESIYDLKNLNICIFYLYLKKANDLIKRKKKFIS